MGPVTSESGGGVRAAHKGQFDRRFVIQERPIGFETYTYACILLGSFLFLRDSVMKGEDN